MEEKVRRSMAQFNVSEPTKLKHKCLKNGLVCEKHEIRWEQSPGVWVQEPLGSEGDERNGSLLELLTTHPSPWLHVVPVRPGQMVAFQPSAWEPASAVLSGQAGAHWGGGWDGKAADGWEGACWNAESSERRARDATSRSSSFHLSYRAAIAMHATERGGPIAGVRSRISTKCEAFALLRPRQSLRKLIAPIVHKLDKLRAQAGSLTGLHIRTGYPDWVALAAWPNGTARSSWLAASRSARKLTYAEHWQELESYLDECPPPPPSTTTPAKPLFKRTANGFELAGAAPKPCFRWKYPKSGASPSASDARQLCGYGAKAGPCRLSQGCHSPAKLPEESVVVANEEDADGMGPPSLHLPGNGTLAAAVVCATRMPQRRSGRSGILVLGDAPGIVSLLKQHPQLQVVDTSIGGRLAHTQFDAACQEETTCTHGMASDPKGGWARTAVDFYVGGLVDAFVSALDTTFLDGAVLLRSMLCCGSPGARQHLSATSTAESNRDRPMEYGGFLEVLMREA